MSRSEPSRSTIGKSPPRGTAGHNQDRSIGERVHWKYCQSKPDSTNAMVRTIAAKCQMSIRPLKHSMMFLGSVEKNSFIFAWSQSLLHCANL